MNQRPRVAVFADCFYEVNGVANTMRHLERYALDNEHPMFFLRAGTHTQRKGDFLAHEIKRSRFHLALDVDFGFDLLFWRHLRKVRAGLETFRPDVIHITGPGDCGLLGALLGWRMHIPVVASWHTNVHEFARRRLEQAFSWLPARMVNALGRRTEDVVLALTSLFYKVARHIVAPNPEIAEVLRRRTGKPVSIMTRGIDVSLFNPQRRCRSDRELRMGYVGRLTPEKNVRLIARIDEALRREGITGCRFVFIGEGGERPWLASHIRDAEFTGVLKGEKLAAAYANLDVLLFPSHTDTFGNVVLEAQASGVPVLVTSSGGPKFLIEPGRTGWIAENDDSFVAKAVEIAKSRETLQPMRGLSREAALALGWPQVFSDLYKVYRSVAFGAPEWAARGALSVG